LKWLWITLGTVAALLVVGGGAFAFIQYTAPAAAAGQFCTDPKAQSDDSAYNLLSAKLQAVYTQKRVPPANGVLDAAEGKVASCGSTSGSYSYSLGGSTASVTAVITRQTQGTLQGKVQLVNGSGGWKVDALETSLLGINPGALQTLGAFC